MAALLLAGCGSDPAKLTVRPVKAPADAPLRAVATGLDAGEATQLRVRARDRAGRTWSGRVRVKADRAGRLTRDAAALLNALDAGPDSDGVFAPPAELRATFELVREGEPPARAEATRVFAAGRPAELTVRRDGVAGTVYAGGGREVPVILLGGSEGGASLADVAGLLAVHGHTSLALAYFGAPGLPAELARVPVDHVWRAARDLRRKMGRKPVVIGVSRGAELALLAASMAPDDFAGVIAYAPSAVVNPAPDARTPAWSAGGRIVPYVRRALGDPAPAGSEARAIIRVERIQGPVVLVTGGDDGLFPASAHGLAIAQRRGGKTIELDFPDAGHGIGGVLPYLPVDPPAEFGGTREADAAARQDAWPEVLRMLGG